MNFFTTFKNEAKMILTNFFIMITVIGGVVLYSVLYPQAYAKQSVSELIVSVVDYDKSDISRDLIFKLNSTAQIIITRHDASEIDAKEALKRAEVMAIVIIPKDFKKDLLLHKSPTIAVGADNSYALIYAAVLEGAMKAILTEIATIKVVNLLKKAVPLSTAEKSYSPYMLNIMNLFNKDNSYIQYVVPGVLILVLQQTLLIGMGILGGSINERMGRREEEYFKYAPVWQMFLSRYLIFGAIYFVHILYYFGFVFEFYDISRLGNISDLLTFSIAFLVASISVGLFLGSAISSSEIATPAVLFTSLPLIFSTGFIWPLESLPSSIYYLSFLAPSTPAIHGLLGLNHMGTDFEMVIDSYIILWVQSAIYLGLAYIILLKKRKTSYSESSILD